MSKAGVQLWFQAILWLSRARSSSGHQIVNYSSTNLASLFGEMRLETFQLLLGLP